VLGIVADVLLLLSTEIAILTRLRVLRRLLVDVVSPGSSKYYEMQIFAFFIKRDYRETLSAESGSSDKITPSRLMFFFFHLTNLHFFSNLIAINYSYHLPLTNCCDSDGFGSNVYACRADIYKSPLV
jgi:hypothetical protein